ncbi:MAG: 30S ribosomal protein S4 [Nitrososphaerota archaeon]|nr:30S ribosomal protein S4 [Nitrososphaerales archaeon]MDW8044641.1 30S ribosomal protein S4 [Nitrososphaerota archaeon]
MGDPKKPRKKYSSPRHPWRSDQLLSELNLVGTYGLRNKRELWKAKTELSRIRHQARLLLATPPNERIVKESKLMSRLRRLGLISSSATLDDVLGLTVEDILNRRLQTIVWKKGLAKTPYQARQMITHGHIMVNDRVVTIPSYMVSSDEEGSVRIREDSPLIKVVQSGGKAA